METAFAFGLNYDQMARVKSCLQISLEQMSLHVEADVQTFLDSKALTTRLNQLDNPEKCAEVMEQLRRQSGAHFVAQTVRVPAKKQHLAALQQALQEKRIQIDALLNRMRERRGQCSQRATLLSNTQQLYQAVCALTTKISMFPIVIIFNFLRCRLCSRVHRIVRKRLKWNI